MCPWQEALRNEVEERGYSIRVEERACNEEPRNLQVGPHPLTAHADLKHYVIGGWGLLCGPAALDPIYNEIFTHAPVYTCAGDGCLTFWRARD